MNADVAVARQPAVKLLPSYALFLGTACFVIMVFAAPFFRVSHVSVEGVGSSQTAVAAASGAEGMDIFTVSGSSILANLQRVPNIQVTGVNVSLPNSVTIQARPRTPVMAFRQKGTLFLIDRYGRLISRVAKTTLPKVDNATSTTYALGGYIPEAAVTAAQYARVTLRHAGIYGFALADKRGLMIHSGHGWTAVLGLSRGRRLVTRVATLGQVVTSAAAQGERLMHVDLRSHAPYVSMYP